jgi:sigma-B regulation protein RsbU (phosphoserine phosphatase)
MASGRFATFCYARLDCGARRLTYSNAGHNPPLLVRSGGSFERLTEGGMVLGVFPDNAYGQAELSLAPGDRLVFYTDGITEVRNQAGEEFGEDRLAESAIAARGEKADGVRDAILTAVTTFSGGAFEDDATLIVVGIR